MPNKPIKNFETFEDLFKIAEERPGYWVELGKLEFSEEILARMKEFEMSKSELATRLGAKPSFVTRLLSGHNNFTMETMVRAARALGCEFRCHLQRAGTKTRWIDILKEEPRHAASDWGSAEFRQVITVRPEIAYEPVTFAA